MRATKAYIASLGTTGVLLGAALFMLAVVGAVVAFNRWPAGDVSTRVQTVLIGERAHAVSVRLAPARASIHASAAPRHVATARSTTPVARVPQTSVPNLQRVAGEPVAGGRTTTPEGGERKAPPLNDTPLPDPHDLVPDNPHGLASAVADQAQAAAGDAGVSVGQLSPDAGQAVSSTGTQAADAVRSLPLPGSLSPGA